MCDLTHLYVWNPTHAYVWLALFVLCEPQVAFHRNLSQHIQSRCNSLHTEHIYICAWVMSRTWMSRVTQSTKHIYILYIWMSHIIRMNPPYHTHEWVLSYNRNTALNSKSPWISTLGTQIWKLTVRNHSNCSIWKITVRIHSNKHRIFTPKTHT